MLIEGTEPEKYYDLATYNDGVFPYVIRRYKYLYLRNSQDFSGSQAFFKLNQEKPYELIPEKYVQTDVVYDDNNMGSDVEDNDSCLWEINLYVDELMEYKLTQQDENYLEQYKIEIERMESENQE